MLRGIKLTTSEHAMSKRWNYPDWGKFWSFEPSPETEKWCRFFGFGHQTYEPAAYMFGDTLIAHPVIAESIRAAARSTPC